MDEMGKNIENSLANKKTSNQFLREREEMERRISKVFLESVIRNAVIYTEHAMRKTVTAIDVVYATGGGGGG